MRSATPAGADLLGRAEAALRIEQEVLTQVFDAAELGALHGFVERFEAAYRRPGRR